MKNISKKKIWILTVVLALTSIPMTFMAWLLVFIIPVGFLRDSIVLTIMWPTLLLGATDMFSNSALYINFVGWSVVWFALGMMIKNMNIKNQSLLLLSGISLFISGCNLPSEPLSTDVELALSPGMIVEFENANGQMKIEALSEIERAFTWDGATRIQKLTPRDRRWYGSKGISSSGHWQRRERTRPILSEGQQHFCSEAEAVQWLNYGWNENGIHLVYTSDGLAAGFAETKHRSQINIDVWQIYINGNRPVSLHGAQDDKVRISYANGISKLRPAAGKFSPSQPQVINGIHYSGRILDSLKEYRIPRSFEDVEDILENGKMETVEDNYTIYQLDYNRVILDPAGTVIFAMFD